MKKTLVIACLLGLCGGSVAMAHQGGFGGGLGRLDGDGDGKVTLIEMQKAAQDHFTKVDANQDGRVTKDEVAALRAQMQSKRADFKAKRFASKDTDRDGRLSSQEVTRMPAERFARIDTNKDGYLSQDELAAKAQTTHARHGERTGKRGEKMFERADSNRDGAVDANEVNAQVASRFAKLDANHDGAIAKDELHRGFAGCEGKHERGSRSTTGTAGSGAER